MPVVATRVLGVPMTERKTALERVIMAVDTYRQVSRKRGPEFDIWREDARRNLDVELLAYLGFTESATIESQRKLLTEVLGFLEHYELEVGKVEGDWAAVLRVKVKNELGIKSE